MYVYVFGCSLHMLRLWISCMFVGYVVVECSTYIGIWNDDSQRRNFMFVKITTIRTCQARHSVVHVYVDCYNRVCNRCFRICLESITQSLIFGSVWNRVHNRWYSDLSSWNRVRNRYFWTITDPATSAVSFLSFIVMFHGFFFCKCNIDYLYNNVFILYIFVFLQGISRSHYFSF